jgi:hypothetical protein
MKCINKSCNNRINIFRKFEYCQNKTCKCGFGYFIINPPDYSGYRIELETSVGDYGIVCKICKFKEDNSDNFRVMIIYSVIKDYESIFAKQIKNNCFIFSDSNIENELRKNYNICKKYIEKSRKK